MKKLILSTALCLVASMASATTCDKKGSNYECNTGGTIYTVANASSEAEAKATAEAYANQAQGQVQGQQQGQTQGQGQSQSSENTNENNNSNVNGGNSVNIEGAPKHTTSVGLGLNIGVDIPIGRGIQGASCRETVLLAHQLGYHDIALHVLLECPHVRKLKLKVNPGDKG